MRDNSVASIAPNAMVAFGTLSQEGFAAILMLMKICFGSQTPLVRCLMHLCMSKGPPVKKKSSSTITTRSQLLADRSSTPDPALIGGTKGPW